MCENHPPLAPLTVFPAGDSPPTLAAGTLLLVKQEDVVDCDRVKGKLKQGEGKLTGDDDRRSAGEWQESKGRAKDKAAVAKDATTEKLEDAKDQVT